MGYKENRSAGVGALVGADSDLLTGTDGRQIVGFVTSQTFDQVRITLANLVAADLGVTYVYRAVVEDFCYRRYCL